jgi:hypothetical protein
LTLALLACRLLPGCGSDRSGPLPAEAKIPGELKPPTYTDDKNAVAKNVNLKAARSIKDLQPNP